MGKKIIFDFEDPRSCFHFALCLKIIEEYYRCVVKDCLWYGDGKIKELYDISFDYNQREVIDNFKEGEDYKGAGTHDMIEDLIIPVKINKPDVDKNI